MRLDLDRRGDERLTAWPFDRPWAGACPEQPPMRGGLTLGNGAGMSRWHYAGWIPAT